MGLKVRLGVIVSVGCAIMAACGPRAPHIAQSPCDAQPHQVLAVTEAPYASNSGYNKRLDLYLPWHRAGEPLVVFVHGGGWVSGDKHDYGHIGRFFARCGIAFASINYPLAPRVRADVQAAAVLQAARWLNNRSAVYGYAGDRIFLMGHSAGAELVTLAVLGAPALRRAPDQNIEGVIALAGLGYAPTPAGAERLPANIANYYRAAFGRNIRGWRRFNVEHPGRAIAPPFLIVHGNEDTFVPEIDSRDLARSLARSGNSVVYLQAFGRDHTTVLSAITRDPNDATGLAIEHFIFSGSLRR